MAPKWWTQLFATANPAEHPLHAVYIWRLILVPGIVNQRNLITCPFMPWWLSIFFGGVMQVQLSPLDSQFHLTFTSQSSQRSSVIDWMTTMTASKYLTTKFHSIQWILSPDTFKSIRVPQCAIAVLLEKRSGKRHGITSRLEASTHSRSWSPPHGLFWSCLAWLLALFILPSRCVEVL